MSKHNCKICRDRLVDYIDGRLDDAEALSLRKHFAASPSCAGVEKRLRAFLLDVLPREDSTIRLPDPELFLARVNAGIDRGRHGRDARRPALLPVRRPAFAIPLLAVMLLVVAGITWLALPDSGHEGLFPTLLTAEDLRGIGGGEDIVPLLEQITLGDLATSAETRVDEIVPSGEVPGLGEEIDLTLLEGIPYSDVVSASLEYISPLEAVETLEDSEIDVIVSKLESNRFTVL